MWFTEKEKQEWQIYIGEETVKFVIQGIEDRPLIIEELL